MGSYPKRHHRDADDISAVPGWLDLTRIFVADCHGITVPGCAPFLLLFVPFFQAMSGIDI